MPARHPGLVAKQLLIRRTKGKPHLQTYWVRPLGPQVARLRRVQGNVPPAPAPTVAPKASLNQWFAAHGVATPLSPRELHHLTRLFQKPEESPLTGHDLEAMFGNPGKTRVQLMQHVLDAHGHTEIDETTGEPKVEPRRDAHGNALYREMHLQWQFHHIKVDADVLSVGAHLVSTDTPPVPVGTMRREFTRQKDGTVSVYHELLKLDARYNGGGVGSGIIKKMVAAYPTVGVQHISVSAAWIGRYTWATMGFEMDSVYKAKNARDFKTFIEQTTGVRAGDPTYYDIQGRTPILRPDKTPYSTEELVALHNFKGSTWRAASAVIPVWDEARQAITTRKLGKEFLLHPTTEGWSGGITLEEDHPGYQRMQSYLGLTSPAQAVRMLHQKANDARVQANLLHFHGKEEEAKLLRQQVVAQETEATAIALRAREERQRAREKGQRHAALATIENRALAKEEAEAAAKQKQEEVARAERMRGAPSPSLSSQASADAAREARNLTAAAGVVTAGIAYLQHLQTNGGTAAQLKAAKASLSGAIAAKERLENATAGEPFDDEERAERRTLHKGVEAASGVSDGLRALHRLAKARGPSVAKQDRARVLRNLVAAEAVEKLAREHLAGLEAQARQGKPPSAQELRAARLNVMTAANQPAQLRRALTLVPKDAAEAARLRQHQMELETGAALPAGLRDLHRLRTARQPST